MTEKTMHTEVIRWDDVHDGTGTILEWIRMLEEGARFLHKVDYSEKTGEYTLSFIDRDESVYDFFDHVEWQVEDDKNNDYGIYIKEED